MADTRANGPTDISELRSLVEAFFVTISWPNHDELDLLAPLVYDYCAAVQLSGMLDRPSEVVQFNEDAFFAVRTAVRDGLKLELAIAHRNQSSIVYRSVTPNGPKPLIIANPISGLRPTYQLHWPQQGTMQGIFTPADVALRLGNAVQMVMATTAAILRDLSGATTWRPGLPLREPGRLVSF
ncbi:MAG TPA: hypothetical protein VGH44_06725 [Candidatus Saccharimonadia bacterium]|jgi:hypothetical protein